MAEVSNLRPFWPHQSSDTGDPKPPTPRTVVDESGRCLHAHLLRARHKGPEWSGVTAMIVLLNIVYHITFSGHEKMAMARLDSSRPHQYISSGDDEIRVSI